MKFLAYLNFISVAQINSRFKSKDNSESFNNMHAYTFYS